MTETVEMTDLSYCQKGAVDWDHIGESLGAVAIRTSQDDFIDSEWTDHADNAIRVGMPFFGWHFVQPDQGPTAQIATMLEALGMIKYKPKCHGFDVENIAYTTISGVKINIEPLSREKATLWLMQIIQGVMRGTNLPQEAMIIYTRKDYWEKWFLPSGMKFSVNGIEYTTWDWSKCGLWIAVWTNYSNNITLPSDWTTYLIHQYQGGTGRIDHITGASDKDRYNGTYQEMIAKLGKPVAVPIISPAVITIPYTATVKSSFLTVCALPDVNSAQLAWLKHGDKVTVTAEQNGWGKIVNGWVLLIYLENKMSINPVPPIPVPDPIPTPDLTITQLNINFQAVVVNLNELNAKLGHTIFVPIVIKS